MVLVQLFIIRIALSSWAAPSYPFSLLLYHTAAPPLSQGAHTHICTVLIWMADFIIIIQWWLPHHNKPQFLLECIPLKCHKIRQKTPHLSQLIARCLYVLSANVYRPCTGAKLLLPFSQNHLSVSSSSSLLFHAAFSLPALSLCQSQSGPPGRVGHGNGVNAR